MADMTARLISATFSDWRIVKGRKVLQLIFEVPIEQQTEVLTLLGPPGIAEDKWCAIALLNEQPKGGDDNKSGTLSTRRPEHKTPPQAALKEATPGARAKRKFSELSLPEQAGVRCADKQFQRFLNAWCAKKWNQAVGESALTDQWAAEIIRRECCVESRAQLSHNHDAGNRWRRFEIDYQNWLATQAYAESVR